MSNVVQLPYLQFVLQFSAKNASSLFWHNVRSNCSSLKVTAVKVALSSGSQNQKESSLSKPLKDQAFATPEKVAELVQKV